MSWSWANGFAAVVVCASPSMAQLASVRELGVGTVATASDPSLAGLLVSAAWRPSDRARLVASAGPGISADELAWRAELSVDFLLDPAARQGVGFYLGGGIAAVGGAVDRGYLMLLVGAEQRPGGRSGWLAELGIGGGLRGMFGYRWRWRDRPRR